MDRRARADRPLDRPVLLLLRDLPDLHYLQKEAKSPEVEKARHLGPDHVFKRDALTSGAESLLEMVATAESLDLPDPPARVDRYREKLVLVRLS